MKVEYDFKHQGEQSNYHMIKSMNFDVFVSLNRLDDDLLTQHTTTTTTTTTTILTLNL